MSDSNMPDIDILKKQLEQLNEDTEIDRSEYKYIFDNPNQVKKQTDAHHEIHINLTANILENVEGEIFPKSKNIYVNNYYIPVPSGHDHIEYVRSFFEYIENCMTSSAEQSSEQESKP